MNDILARIAAYKRDEVAAAKKRIAPDAMEAQARTAPPPRDFASALRACHATGRPALIAEIKKASPSRGIIRADFDPPALALAYAGGGAACLSVLTDGPSFGGEAAFLAQARDASGLPALRKDFLLEPYQVFESRALGADCVLVIMAMLTDREAGAIHAAAASLGMAVLVEVHDEAELDRALSLSPSLVGVNNRDLRTFETSLAVSERLAPRMPDGVVRVTESGIFTPADIARMREAGFETFLVGESLMREQDVAAATRQLLQPKRDTPS